MTKKDIIDLSISIIGSVGGAALIIAGLSSWLGKVWANRFMQADIASYNKELEELKSKFKRLENEHQIKFSQLHLKQANVISEVYGKLYDVNTLRSKLILKLSCREIKESFEMKHKKREAWEYIYGVDTLTEAEQADVKTLFDSLSDLNSFYRKNKLYIPHKCCKYMDIIINMSYYIQSNYDNVAFKDCDGNLMVNPKVKEVWDNSIEAIDLILPDLESEFRKLTGVVS